MLPRNNSTVCYQGISKLKDTVAHTVLVLLSDFTLFVQGSEINGESLGGEGEAKIPPYLFTGSFITILGGASGK